MTAQTAMVIRNARGAKGWKQRELAEATGFSVQTVRNWEAGSNPCAAAWAMITDVLGVDPFTGSMGIGPCEPTQQSREDLIDALRQIVADENGIPLSAVKFVVTITL